MPKKVNGYTHRKADARKAERRDEAETRQAKYDALSAAEKIALATNRGGSKRELARLTNPKPKQVAASSPVEVRPKNKYRKKN